MKLFLSPKYRLGVLFLFAALSGLPALKAQNANANAAATAARVTAETRKATQDAAYHDFKNGNAVAGLVRLDQVVKRGQREPDADLQIAGELFTVSSRLSTDGDTARASEAAALALQKITVARTRVATKESGAAAALAGQIHDYILRDTAQATAAYENALALDPSLKLVAERLAQIRAAAAQAAQKTAANDLLRQRAREGAR